MRHRTNQQRHHTDPTIPTNTNHNHNNHINNNHSHLAKTSSFGDGDAAAGISLSSLSPIDERRKSSPMKMDTVHTVDTVDTVDRVEYSHEAENGNGLDLTGHVHVSPQHAQDTLTNIQSITLPSLSSNLNSTSHSTSNSNSTSRNKVIVLGINISTLSRKYQFAVCAGGVFFFSLFYGYLQELISVTLCHRQLGLFLAMFQFIGYFGWSGLLKNIGRGEGVNGESKSKSKSNKSFKSGKSSAPSSGNLPTLSLGLGCLEDEGTKDRRKRIFQKFGTQRRQAIPPIVSLSNLEEKVVTDAATAQLEQQQQQQQGGTSSITNPTAIHTTSNISPSKPKVPFHFYILLSCLRAIDTGCTNMAMAYVNYPAKTLMKSCRIVFTMLLGSIVNKRRYAPIDYGIVFVMVTGLGLFLHADSNHSSAIFEVRGILLLCMSLTCDGVSNNISERLMNQYDIGQDEYIYRQYSIATLGIFVAALVKGELTEGIKYLSQPGTYDEILEGSTTPSWSVMGKLFAMIVFSSAGYFAGSCCSAITKEFGALAMTITSTARKAMTLFISFLMFDHVCTMEHVSGMILFIAALVTKSIRTSKKGHPGGQYRTNPSKGHGDEEEVGSLSNQGRDDEKTALLKNYSSRQVEMGNMSVGNTFKRRITGRFKQQSYPAPLIV